MTKREMFVAIVNSQITDEVIEKAKEEIILLDKANERKKSKTSSSKAEINEPIKARIVEFLKGREWTLGSVIAEGCEISTNKAVALVKQIEDIEVTDVKVPKVGTRKAYRLAR